MCQVDEGEDVCLGLGKVCCSRSWFSKRGYKTCPTLVNKHTNHKKEMEFCCEGLSCNKVDDSTGIGTCEDETGRG